MNSRGLTAGKCWSLHLCSMFYCCVCNFGKPFEASKTRFWANTTCDASRGVLQLRGGMIAWGCADDAMVGRQFVLVYRRMSIGREGRRGKSWNWSRMAHLDMSHAAVGFAYLCAWARRSCRWLERMQGGNHRVLTCPWMFVYRSLAAGCHLRVNLYLSRLWQLAIVRLLLGV